MVPDTVFFHMTINLYKSRESDCYMAQFIGGQEIVDMFRTDTIPTGFTGQSKPEVMIAQVIATIEAEHTEPQSTQTKKAA